MKYSKLINFAGLSLLCCFILLFIPTKISKGCGFYENEFYGYSFLNPNIIDIKAAMANYFAGFEKVFEALTPEENIQEKDNLTEWQERFCDIPKIEDLNYLIYKASISQMKTLQTIMKQKDGKLTGLLAKNSFARHLQQNKCEEAVEYLIFAKRCEPHVIATDSWSPPKRDTAAMQFLIKDGLKVFKKLKSHYFKLRYAYQLIRLAHYKKNYTQALELYDYLMPKIDHKPSLIENWILGHKAGALMGLGQNVEAAYLYSKIFEHTPSKRTTAYQSFTINSNEEWTACLNLCQDDNERATLYALRAIDPNSQVVEEMEAIYDLDAQQKYLELLLARAIQDFEKDFLGLDFNKRKKDNLRYHNLPRKQAGQNLVRFQNLVRKAISEEKVKTLALWKIADGYLELLGGDYYAARKTLENLKGNISNTVLEEQLDAMIMVANIGSMQAVNTKMENLVGEYQQNDLFKKYPDFGKFMKDKLTQIYLENGMIGKAFLEQHTLEQLRYNPQLEIIDELIAICKKEDRTKLEDAMVLKSDGLTTIESDLWDLKGTYFLGQMQLEPALDAYRKMPRKDRDNYGLFNPFRENIIDCVNCRIVDTASYNKVDILEQLLELEYKAKADMENGAFYYYKIGIALYNMTFFGYEWEVADYFRSGSSWYNLKGKNVFNNFDAPYGNRETVNCSLPLYYFDKAFRLALNNELAARAAFMAAKCQQNLFYTQKESDYSLWGDQIPNVPTAYRQYFQILKEHYAETQFYEMAIEECLYFEKYVARN